jgi:apolipoprotein N-acyltransferase
MVFNSFVNWLRLSTTFWGRALVGAFGGAFIAISFPAFNFWPGVFIGYFLVILSFRQLGFLKSFVVGSIAGFAYFGLVLKWLTTYLGPIPWFALSFVQALMFGLAVAVAAMLWKWISALNLGGMTPLALAFSIGAVFTAREFVAGTFPYGGMPWARAGLSLVDTWLARWVYYIDVAGLTWLIVFVTALFAIRFTTVMPQGLGLQKRLRAAMPTAVTVALVLGIPAVTVLDSSPSAGTLKVAAIQGNANAGLFAVNPPGSILDKHLEVSKDLVSSGKARDVDLMVWPENSSDLDPNTMVEPGLKISEFVTEELNAPLLFGTKTFRGTDFFNEVDLWLPETGLADHYQKKRPVPFGEYVPNRPFFMALAPDMVGLIGWDMSFGTRDGIFELPSGVKVGSLICFEVAFDYLGHDLVKQGAEAIMVQTNSSDFGESEQGVQQAAISRMRAIETGRTVVSISTVGVSGIYAPDGSVISELESFKPGSMVEEIALRKEITPAVMFGGLVEPSAFVLTLLLFPLAIVGMIRRRLKARRS